LDKGVLLMTTTLHTSPVNQNTGNHLKQTGSRRNVETDEGNGSPLVPVESDICSPSDATESSQYDGESLDFGDAGMELI
jgi:hypothetical protein